MVLRNNTEYLGEAIMRFMVIGASGYLGNNVFKELKNVHGSDVLGTCCKTENKELIKINLKNNEDVKKILLYKPDVIIWCAMDSSDEEELTRIGLTEIINNITKETRFIYISTTVGQGREQTEDVKPCYRKSDEYLSSYVNGKIEGEKIVNSHSNHVIVRPGSIYGYDYDGKMDARMATLLEISKSSKKYSRTANLYTSFVCVNDLVNVIQELIFSDFTGIINVAGEKAISHYDFNKALARFLSVDDSFIVPDYKAEAIYHNLNSKLRKTVLKTSIQELETSVKL